MVSIYIAILVATAVSYVLSMIWYSPFLFQNTYMRLSNITKKDMKDFNKWNMVIAFGIGYVTYSIIGYILHLTQMLKIEEAAFMGAVVWLGFIVTTQLDNVLWGKTPLQLVMLQSSIKLITFVLGAITIVLLI